MKNRNIIMDGLRGVASMWVVLFHLNEVIPYAPNFWQEFCKKGWLGVPIFFVISGWCMAMITQRERSPLAFLAKRFLRIFPPYWASLGVVVAIAVARYFWTGTNDVAAIPRGAGALIATVTLATQPATVVPAINWVYWSLTYEVMFYLLVAAGLFCRRLSLILVLILPLCLLRTAYAHNDTYGGPLFFADQFPLFALGFFCRNGKFTWRSLAVIGVTVAFCFTRSGTLSTWVALAAAGLLAWSEWRPAAIREWLRPLAKIGDWSYSLYLIHVPLGCYLLVRCRGQVFLDNIFLHMVFDLGALAVCVACAWLMHVAVEQPSHRLGELVAAKLKPRPVAANGSVIISP